MLGHQEALPENGRKPSPARQRRSRERAAARERILSAALGVAQREGWDAVTMRRLADEIEYSANFAYRYFTGRDDILKTLVIDGFSQLCAEMVTASQQAGALDSRYTTLAHSTPDGDALRVATLPVRRAGHAYLDFALADPDLYQLMYGLGGVRVPAIDAWAEGQAVGDIMAELLTAAGDLCSEQHVLQLWATAHGLIALLVVGRVNVDGDGLHVLFEEALMDCLIRALPLPANPGHIDVR